MRMAERFGVIGKVVRRCEHPNKRSKTEVSIICDAPSDADEGTRPYVAFHVPKVKMLTGEKIISV